MKLFLSFLVLVAVFQFGSSNVLSKRGTQEQLLSDAAAVQNGSNVIMVKPGPLEVILADGNELVFKVCSLECKGDFLVCYAPHPSNQNVLEDSCDTNSGFYITTLGVKISFMEPITSENFGVVKSDLCFEVKRKNGATSVLSSAGEKTKTKTCAPKIVNGLVKLNIINATSECSVSGKNAIAKHEPTTAPPTTTLGQLDQTLLGGNGHVSAATTDEPESFFADYGWIFLILGITLIGIGVGVRCYLRRKNNAKKPIPTRRRKLRESQSPVISTETQKGKTENAVWSDSLFQQSSILSQKEKSMPLSSLKQQLLHQQQRHWNNLIKLHLVKMNMTLLQQPMNQNASLLIIGRFFQSLVLSLSPLVLELASTVTSAVKRNHKNLFLFVDENFKGVNPLLFYNHQLKLKMVKMKVPLGLILSTSNLLFCRIRAYFMATRKKQRKQNLNPQILHQ